MKYYSQGKYALSFLFPPFFKKAYIVQVSLQIKSTLINTEAHLVVPSHNFDDKIWLKPDKFYFHVILIALFHSHCSLPPHYIKHFSNSTTLHFVQLQDEMWCHFW